MSEPKPTYRDAAHPRLLAVAQRLLEAEGLSAVQARRVSREAGCSVGTLYNVFGDIDGLIIALNAGTLALLGEAVKAGASSAADASLESRLCALALAYMRFAVANPARWEAVFKHRLPPGREVPASYIEDQSRLLAVIEAAIAEVVPDVGQRQAAARALFGAVHGIVALALDDRLGGRLKDELEAQMAFISGVIARGLPTGA